MNQVFLSYLYFNLLLIILAFFIVKDMNFHPRYDKHTTPQKPKRSEISPTVKRIRLISPSPIEKMSTDSDDKLISLNTVGGSLDKVNHTVTYFFLLFS